MNNNLNLTNMEDSKINIYFDETFKVFIRVAQVDMRNELEYITNNIGTGFFYAAQQCQHKIREYIIKNQDKINFNRELILKEGSNISFPNFFAIFVALTTNETQLNTANSFNDILDTIDKKFFCSLFSNMEEGEVDEFMEVEIKSYCCCSHECKAFNNFYIMNQMTGQKIMVGCDCVNKRNLIEPELIKKMKKEVKNSPYGKRIENNKKSMKSKVDYIKNLQKVNIMKSIFKVLKNNVLRKCLSCKNIINKQEYKLKCSNPLCDCKLKSLQRSYCYPCAGTKFSKPKT